MAIRGLRFTFRALSPAAQEDLRKAARRNVRLLILKRQAEAANLLRLMTGTVEPEF